MIKIKNLTKSFGDAKILKGINLEIKQNEFCVLLGGSGSGKTTLLNILSGTSELSSGEISMQNKIYTKKISLDKSRQIIFKFIAPALVSAHDPFYLFVTADLYNCVLVAA